MVEKSVAVLFLIITLAVPVLAVTEEDMTSGLVCPCECAMIISTCDCSTAIQIKNEISAMKRTGFSENQIVAALQAEYGREILVHPEKASSSWWIAGTSVALLLVFVGYIMRKKTNPDIIPVSDREKYEQQFEEEYRKYVSEYKEPENGHPSSIEET